VAWIERQVFHFFQSNDVLIRNFPTEISHLHALGQMLLEKDRAARIGNEGTGGRQQNITGAIVHFDLAPKKGGVPGHTITSFGFRKDPGNSTEVLLRTNSETCNLAANRANMEKRRT